MPAHFSTCPSCNRTQSAGDVPADRGRRFVCSRCGSVTPGVQDAPGSILLGVVLVFLAMIPGILFFIWRSAKTETVCTECGSSELVPTDSPRGKRLLEPTDGEV